MDIRKYIGETTEYDKKQEVERRKVKSWLKSVSAFANGVGGCLLFGIADDDTVAGLTDAKGDAEFVSQKIKERIDPVPQVNLKIESVDGRDLLILHVQGGDDTPYYYMGDSVLETFVRIGNESVVADATEHKRLVLNGRNSSFDARPSDERFDDFSFSKLRSRYYAWSGVSFDSKLYRSFGMVDNKGILTYAGLLMADECPLRQSRVFCTRWNGTTRAGGSVDALDSAEITGGLVTLLEDTMSFIRRNTRTMWYKEPMQRVEIPEYMERSVLEAVVNALAHRDYLIQGSEVHVDMYDDRMAIYSPGGMPEGRLIQNMDLLDIPSIRRNPVVADIFTQLGFMERKGSGMGKILNPIKNLPYFTERLLPKFFSDRAQFTITFPNMIGIWRELHPEMEVNMIEGVDDTQGDTQSGTQDGTRGVIHNYELDKWIEHQVKNNPNITTAKLAELSNRSVRTIKRPITNVQQVKFVGKGVHGHWEIVSGAIGQVSGQVGGQVSGQASGQVQQLIQVIDENIYTISDLLDILDIASRRYVREKMLQPAIEQGYVLRAYPDKPNHPKQRYYLSEKGLKLIKEENA